VPKEGFMDFSVIQFTQNRIVEANAESRLYLEDVASQKNISIGQPTRFLRNKYILVRDNAAEIYQDIKSSKVQASSG
jgi:hypothetical protein